MWKTLKTKRINVLITEYDIRFFEHLEKIQFLVSMNTLYISNQSKQAWDIYTQDGGICFDKFYSYILKSEEF
jgi:hypothetical protein